MSFFDRPVRAKKKKEEIASLTETANPVRWLLDSVSGLSTCSPDFALHARTHTKGSVRARSATGQVTRSLGKKTVNFEMSGIPASVNMEVPKVSRPTMSAGKMTRKLGREALLN